MHYDTPLITTIVAGFVLAFVFGAIANRLRMPPLVGYLVAGVAVGPYTPGVIADSSLASQLSEIGVILLMFGVGLHFSLKDLLSVQAVAVPGALLRIAGGTAMGIGLALVMGWSVGAGLVFGLALSVASTVVLLKALQERHLVDSDRGRIAIGWVIVEDIAMVLALVLIPAMGPMLGAPEAEVYDPFVNFIERVLRFDIGLPGVLVVTLVKLVAFGGFMLIVGRRLIPSVLHFTAHSGSRELFRLAVLAIALGVAAGSAYLFGVSLALGAFFAGMILSESELSHRAAQESLPLRDAFSVLFFVSVGMLFDPSILLSMPWQVLGVLFIILFGKSAIGFIVVLLLRRPASSALTISASLAQIGEFSFILATLGVGLGIMPPEGQSLILAGAILSIILNPAMFYLADRLRPWAEHRFGRHEGDIEPGTRIEPGDPVHHADEEADDAPHPTALTNHTVLVGFGRVGRIVAETLKAEGIAFLVIEDADGRIAAAHAAGIEVVVGNGASPESLALANVKEANRLLVTIPNAFEAGQSVEQSRRLNPTITIISRAHSDEEESHLKHLGADEVIMGEREIGLGIIALWREAGVEPPASAGRSVPPDMPPASGAIIVAPAASAGVEPAPGTIAAPWHEDVWATPAPSPAGDAFTAALAPEPPPRPEPEQEAIPPDWGASEPAVPLTEATPHIEPAPPVPDAGPIEPVATVTLAPLEPEPPVLAAVPEPPALEPEPALGDTDAIEDSFGPVPPLDPAFPSDPTRLALPEASAPPTPPEQEPEPPPAPGVPEVLPEPKI